MRSSFKILCIILLLFTSSIIQLSARKLVFVQTLFRHGARYPIFLAKDDFTSQPQIAKNAGQLTNQGKNMHYILGKALYNKYWLRLFNGTQSQKKYCHSDIYIRSTNVNRTIQSVQSQLRGWFVNSNPLQLKSQNRPFSLPAFQNLQNFIDINYTNSDSWNVFNEINKYQSVPIHVGLGGQGVSSSNPFDQGDFLIKFDRLNCPKQDQWMTQNTNSKMFKYINNLPQIKQTINKLAQSFPSATINFTQAYKYVDNYQCMKHLNQPTLPIFSDPKYQKTLKYIKQVSLYLISYYQPIQYQTTGSKLFENIVNNMQKAISGKGPKLVLYSAHDTTVALMLATFNLTNVQCINEYYLKNIQNYETCVNDYPRFASNFIIEVYQQDNNTYTMDIVFNNIQRKIPFCGNKMSCEVQKFYQWFAKWKIQNPNEICGIQDGYQVQLIKAQNSMTRLYAAIIILVIIILLLLIWIWKLKRIQIKTQQNKQGYLDQFQEKQGANKHTQMLGANK